MDIKFIDRFGSIDWNSYEIIVDALFGFSFCPPLREESRPLLEKLSNLDFYKHRIVSIDIPSGWNVETGPDARFAPVIKPDCLVSLSAPKLCARYFMGRYHWLGGRFVPPSLAQHYKLSLPAYEGSQQVVLIHKYDEVE